MLRLKKVVTVLTNWYFLMAFIRFGVVAAVEHIFVIKSCKPKTLIDVGANKGQFSLAFRSVRPDSQIFAFEPLDPAADKYESVFANDLKSRLERSAISDSSGTATFYVADREDSSSLLRLGSAQNEIFAVSQRTETTVKIDKLGAFIDMKSLSHPIMLKVDVQGAELLVLKGIDDIHLIDFIYVELSFIELYSDQPLFQDVSNFLIGQGFGLRGIFNQFVDPERGAIQADCLFKRNLH